MTSSAPSFLLLNPSMQSSAIATALAQCQASVRLRYTRKIEPDVIRLTRPPMSFLVVTKAASFTTTQATLQSCVASSKACFVLLISDDGMLSSAQHQLQQRWMGRSAVGVRMCVSGAQASKVLINTATCSQPSTRQQLRTMLVGRQEEEDERGDRGAQQQQQLARCLENTGQLTQSEAGLIQDGFGSVQRFSSATQHSLLACSLSAQTAERVHKAILQQQL